MQKDPTLNETDRDFALQVAKTHGEDARALNEAARKVVCERDAGKDAYAVGLRRSEAAVRMAPGDVFMLNTLSVALYRMGRYT